MTGRGVWEATFGGPDLATIRDALSFTADHASPRLAVQCHQVLHHLHALDEKARTRDEETR